jgi:release factor glutamine methyltransferase
MAVDMLDSRFDAGQLFFHATQKRVHHLPFMGGKPAPANVERMLRGMCEKRRAGVPLQYILGEWEFYGLPFKVGRGVLIPRSETELLVDTALELARKFEKPEILDLCSGTGCIAVALAHSLPQAKVTALEFSSYAYSFLVQNVALNKCDVQTVQADVDSYYHKTRVDILACNPPYIPSETISTLQSEIWFEPRRALNGGTDGLDFYHVIAKNYRRQINPNGWICFEVGKGQSDQVSSILDENGYVGVTVKNDLAGIPRVVYAKR